MIFPSNSRTGIQDFGTPKDGTPQPDWNVTDDGRGLLSGTLKFFYNHKTGKPAGDVITSVPKRGDRHPYDERLVCKDVQTSFGSNNIGYCDANYVGISQDPSGVEWSLSCPTEEQSIALHPRFVIPVGKEGAWGHLIKIGADGVPQWNTEMVKPVDGDIYKTFESFVVGEKTINADLVGVESYKVSRPSLSITLHTANKQMLFEAIRNVGKQYILPPFAPDWADASRDKRTWLFSSLSVTEYAGIYKLDTEYVLSGIGSDNKGKPWNILIYPLA
jgi:hypothetical protein